MDANEEGMIARVTIPEIDLERGATDEIERLSRKVDDLYDD